MKKTKKKVAWTNKTRWERFKLDMKRNWQLDLLVLATMIYMVMFEIIPLYGIQIAFRDYNPREGIIGSAWVGLKHFKQFFANYQWKTYVLNTIRISLYNIVVGFPIPIILALTLHVNENKFLKKMTQNVSYIPHFISTVVLVGIINQLFNPFSGLWAAIQQLLNLNITADIRSNPDAFDHLFFWSGVWQNMGWSTIIFVAALTAVPDELHEAARIDGASRWKRVLHIDIPTIAPTIATMFILRFAGILGVAREKAYLMQNTLNLEKSEVISTYVYKYGLGKNNYSYGAAVGLMNNAINFVLLLLVNWMSKKMSDDEVSLM